jgi:hypothetical protein
MWVGPCSVHVLVRKVADETSMVILFGEFHEGFVDTGDHGIIHFFRQISHFPTEIFVEN